MQRLIAGVDGCDAGWLAVVERRARLLAFIAPDVGAVVAQLPDVLIAIDIPIGLPDRGSRNCDVQARRLLGRQRGSSVFPAPVRACQARVFPQGVERDALGLQMRIEA